MSSVGQSSLFLGVPSNSGSSSPTIPKSIISLHEERPPYDEERLSPQGERELPIGEDCEYEIGLDGVKCVQRIAVNDVNGSSLEKDFECLWMYYETTSLSGGGPIEQKKLTDDKKTLVITFINAVSNPKLREQYKYKEMLLIVTPLELEVRGEDGRCLAVKIPLDEASVSCDKLTPAIYNYLREEFDVIPRRIYHLEDDNSWIITFETFSDIVTIFGETEETEKTVAYDEEITFKFVKMNVDCLEPLIDGDLEPDKILFTQLPSNIDENKLKRFLEETSENEINKMEIIPGKAMVTFKPNLDLDKLRRMIIQLPFKGCFLKLQRVQLSYAIKVTSHDENELDQQDLMIYFTHLRHAHISHPNESFIQGVVVNPFTKKHAIITFSERQVLNDVLKECEENEAIRCRYVSAVYHECMAEEEFNQELWEN